VVMMMRSIEFMWVVRSCGSVEKPSWLKYKQFFSNDSVSSVCNVAAGPALVFLDLTCAW
jgi:hypothetical protein